MGWTSYHATHYKKGNIDRKAECDAYWEEGLNRGHFEVVKSTIKGSVYYAAVKPLKKCIGKNEKGEYQYTDIPLSEQKIFGVVFLTSTDSKDYYNFSYKDMDETVGPYYYDCPKSILDILSPTDNEHAIKWREKCYEQIKKNKDPDALNNLPEDTIIEVIMPWETKYYKEGDIVQLQKIKWGKRFKWFVKNRSVYFTQRLMKSLQDHYKIIKRGE
jgi:hypothetical protein